MIRFTMPESGLPIPTQVENIRYQLDQFSESEALQDLLKLIHASRNTIRDIYNRRTVADGRVLEVQSLASSDALEPVRYELYPLLKELGAFDICEPLKSDHSRIIVLGGSLNVCCVRTEYAAQIKSSSIKSVDALTCYRPINPVERKRSSYVSAADTEFGVLAEAFSDVFGLDAYDDEFEGDRNLNSISCIRRYTDNSGNCRYGLYAAPSCEPQLRRADTGDTFRFYLDRSDISPDDSLLILTSNRYCNRQFIQLAYQLMKSNRSVYFDIIGTTPSAAAVTPDTYDPLHYIQDLIGTLDWVDIFSSLSLGGKS